MEYLSGLKDLTRLSLFGTQVSDKGVANLKGLTELKEVIANESKVTSAGANALRQALPNVTVIGAK